MTPETRQIITHRPMVPQHWTVQQAIEVTDFLAELIEAIWELHGDRMAQHLRLVAAEEHEREMQRHDPDDAMNDELPL